MKPTAQTPELTQHMFQELERPIKPFSDWELGFLADVLDQFNRTSRLSPKQFTKLEEIYVSSRKRP
jgi:hypothetical protein